MQEKQFKLVIQTSTRTSMIIEYHDDYDNLMFKAVLNTSRVKQPFSVDYKHDHFYYLLPWAMQELEMQRIADEVDVFKLALFYKEDSRVPKKFSEIPMLALHHSILLALGLRVHVYDKQEQE
jgi:hypothetical protein